jgi:2'-5' RNA ligase
MRIRTFVALNLSVPVTRRVTEEVERLKGQLATEGASAPQIAWVPPANYHVTLQFVGGVDEELIEAMADRLGRVTARTEPFELRARGAGHFPASVDEARVLWIGVEGTSERASKTLMALQRQVAEALSGLGLELPPTGQAVYHPHLTVGRVRTGRLPQERFVSTAELGTSVVRELVIYESAAAQPGGGRTAFGVEYRARARIPLGAAHSPTAKTRF